MSTNPSSITNPTDPTATKTSHASQPVTSRTDKHGNVIPSSDPSTADTASTTTKLKGDVQGAIHGTVGGLQAATGATIRNKGMEEKGLDKMSEEDHRLGAKKGVTPVGSSTRNTTVDAGQTGGAGSGV